LSILQIALLLVIGGFAGLAAGFFGIGGGAILVPFLMFFFQWRGVHPQVYVQLTLGTSLLIACFASVQSAYSHHRRGNVLWSAVPYLAGFSILGAFLGSYVAALVPGELLKRIFALFLLFFACRLLLQRGSTLEEQRPSSMHLAPPIGFASGFGGALLGLGGGVFMIPLMISVLHIPVKKVAGTSSAVIIFTALSGVLGYMWHGWNHPYLPAGALGYVSIRAAVPTLVGSVALARLGAYLNARLSAAKLRIGFGVFLLAVFFKMILP